MKELSIEEKAKAYDKAIERAQEAVDNGMVSQNFVDDIFLELKDEDEEFRKDIVTYLKSTLSNKKYGDKVIESWIAWLEKQGWQKSAVDTKVIIPKFRVGDIVKSKSQPMLSPRKIISIGKDCYWCEDRGCIGFAWEDDLELVEQKSADWIQELEYKLSKATPEQLAEWKEKYFKVEPAWSEEDEAMRKTTILYLENTKDSCAAACVPYIVKCINWLKSLRPQSQWRPSENELEVLRLVAEKDGTCLMGLYKNLKKLMEEDV